MNVNKTTVNIRSVEQRFLRQNSCGVKAVETYLKTRDDFTLLYQLQARWPFIFNLRHRESFQSLQSHFTYKPKKTSISLFFYHVLQLSGLQNYNAQISEQEPGTKLKHCRKLRTGLCVENIIVEHLAYFLLAALFWFTLKTKRFCCRAHCRLGLSDVHS